MNIQKNNAGHMSNRGAILVIGVLLVIFVTLLVLVVLSFLNLKSDNTVSQSEESPTLSEALKTPMAEGGIMVVTGTIQEIINDDEKVTLKVIGYGDGEFMLNVDGKTKIEIHMGIDESGKPTQVEEGVIASELQVGDEIVLETAENIFVESDVSMQQVQRIIIKR